MFMQNSFKNFFGDQFIENSNKVLKMNDLFLVFPLKKKLFDESWVCCRQINYISQSK